MTQDQFSRAIDALLASAPGRYTIEEAIEQAARDDARHREPYDVMRDRALRRNS